VIPMMLTGSVCGFGGYLVGGGKIAVGFNLPNLSFNIGYNTIQYPTVETGPSVRPREKESEK